MDESRADSTPRSDAIEARHLLRRVMVLESHNAHAHPWTFEGDRWKELALALLTRSAPHLDESNIRSLVERMHEFRLLDIDNLIAICAESPKPNFGHPHARLLLSLFREVSFTDDESERALLTICEAALGFHRHFNGKIQKYLRSYGEQMLLDCAKIFQFTALGDREIRYAFTFWLQNVLSMPLPLEDSNWEMVREGLGVESKDLIAAADDIDLNLAVMDDLLASYLARTASSDALGDESS